jgi:GT2 family glycosyltransferase
VNFVTTKFPQVIVIANTQNLGYAEGNNVGIRKALSLNANFVWIVNPDIMVDKNSLSSLLEAASKYRQAGIFGSKIYFAPGYEFHKDRYTSKDLGKVIWYAGGNVDWGNLIATHRGVDQVDEGQFNDDLETDFVTGASMFIRSRVFETVGLIDSRYFLYFEENDFCQRVKAAGWQLMYIPDSIAWHANAQATGIGSSLQDYYITRNQMLFGLRHAPLYTKLHLIKQSINLYLNGRPWQKRAILDYYTRNLGPGSYQP